MKGLYLTDAQKSSEATYLECVRLREENGIMLGILKDFLDIKECRETWIEEMNSTIESVVEQME